MHDIHQDFEGIFCAGYTERSQDFKTTEMRAEQDATSPALYLAIKYFALMEFNVEAMKFAGEQINTIQNGCGEVVKMPKYMPPVSWASAHASQLLVRHCADRVSAEQEVEGSWK